MTPLIAKPGKGRPSLTDESFLQLKYQYSALQLAVKLDHCIFTALGYPNLCDGPQRIWADSKVFILQLRKFASRKRLKSADTRPQSFFCLAIANTWPTWPLFWRRDWLLLNLLLVYSCFLAIPVTNKDCLQSLCAFRPVRYGKDKLKRETNEEQ